MTSDARLFRISSALGSNSRCESPLGRNQIRSNMGIHTTPNASPHPQCHPARVEVCLCLAARRRWRLLLLRRTRDSWSASVTKNSYLLLRRSITLMAHVNGKGSLRMSSRVQGSQSREGEARGPPSLCYTLVDSTLAPKPLKSGIHFAPNLDPFTFLLKLSPLMRV